MSRSDAKLNGLRPLDGKQISIKAVSLGLDKFQKLQLALSSESVELEQLRNDYPSLKLPIKQEFGFGGTKTSVTINLGYSKDDATLIRRLQALRDSGKKQLFVCAMKSYSTPKFGTGLYFVLQGIEEVQEEQEE
jgi:hypothetical protein